MYRATTTRSFRDARQHIGVPVRAVHRARSAGSGSKIWMSSLVLAGTATVLVSTTVTARTLHQEQSKSNSDGYETQSQLHKGKLGSITPSVFAWGRNSHNVAAPGSPEVDMVKKPKLVVPFNGSILRDLVVAETYGAAVDKKGDVLLWGNGFNVSSTPSAPRLSLQHHDIIKLLPTATKLFCLSRDGNVYVIPSDLEKQRANERDRQSNAAWWKVWASRDPGTDVEQLKPDSPLTRGEKFVSLTAGTHHLLALTSAGRSFALPLDLQANAFGQLGVRRVQLLSVHPSALSSGAYSATLAPPPSINEPAPLPGPPAKLDPLLLPVKAGKTPEPLGIPDRAVSAPIVPVDNDTYTIPKLHEDDEIQTALEQDIRFATILHEIPALRGVEIAELAAGARHSLARLKDGRVLGWGANGYGQLGLGATLAYPSIAAPTEIPLSRNYPKATRIECARIAAGGNLSYFVVDRTDVPAGTKTVDLLATGNGQFGGIGNGTWAHAPSPVKVKTISGLSEYNDATGRVEPIRIREISAGNAHIAIVLDNAVEQAGGVKFGRDVFVWGHNMYHQLGTGKRSNLSTPQHLPPLPYAGLVAPPKSAQDALALKQETIVESGTTSPMPHSRLQLAPEIKVDGKYVVEEAIVAGDGVSAVYWRIVNP